MSGNLVGHLSFGLAMSTVLVWFGLMRAVRVPRNFFPFTFLFALAAALGIAAVVLGTDPLAGSAAGVAIATGTVFVILALFSGQERRDPAVSVGEPVLDFMAPDEHGDPFELASLRGRPFLLKFFRGHW